MTKAINHSKEEGGKVIEAGRRVLVSGKGGCGVTEECEGVDRQYQKGNGFLLGLTRDTQ